MIRPLLISIFIVITVGVAYSIYEPIPAEEVPCNTLLTYQFGDIDSRFGIEEKELRKIMAEVESLWNGALDKKLISYSEDGQVVIHLIYGEQQKYIEDEKSSSIRIQGKDHQHKAIEREYRQLESKYKESLSEYKKQLSDFNNLVELHNNEIAKWQEKGGVPAGEKKKIREREEKIDRLKNELNQKLSETESLRRRLNQQAELLNKVTNERNKMVKEYNSKFTGPKKFDQGRYVRKGNEARINIYQFGSRQNLKAVMAHEVGHALGLGHVENPKSIMFELMNEQNVNDLQLSREDREALRAKCNE